MINHSTLAMMAGALMMTGCVVEPNQLSSSALKDIAADQKAAVESLDQEPVTQSISIYEAMARALKYNLRHRVAMMEAALARGETRLSRLDMLPSLTLRAGYDGRNNYSGSFSRPILGTRRLGPRARVATTSSELETATGNLTLSWNVLDFGLSYVRAKQAADKQLIARERQRSVANRLIEEVRSAYWRAISADRLRGQFQALERQASAALSRSAKQRRAGLVPPITALTYERELLDIKKQIHNLTASLLVAKAELGKLMNLKPGTKFTLKQPKRFHRQPKLTATLDEMTDIGLQNRPEVRELVYRGRINAAEAKAGLLELLPGVELYLSGSVDSNDLLYNSNWAGYGLKAVWNAMRIVKYPAKKRVIETKGDLIREEALATSMAIMTQIHVGRIRYSILRKELHAADHYYSVQRQLLKQVLARSRAGSAGEQSVIRERMNALVARVKRDVVYADFQNALAAVFWSMGIDPYDATVSIDQPVSEMTDSLRNLWTNGRLPSNGDISASFNAQAVKTNG